MRKGRMVLFAVVMCLCMMFAVAESAELISIDNNGTQGKPKYNYASKHPSITSDGRFVIFQSTAWDWGTAAVYLKDRETGSFTKLAEEGYGPNISDDARFFSYKVYSSAAIDRTGEKVFNFIGHYLPVTLSRNGKYLVYSKDPGIVVFLYNIETGENAYVSGGAGGGFWDTAVTPDGRYVALYCDHDEKNISSQEGITVVPPDVKMKKYENWGGSNIYVRDMINNTIEPASVSNDWQGSNAEEHPGRHGGPRNFVSISDDGRYVAFWSDATNLTPEGVSGIFVRDTVADTTELITKAVDGSPANGDSYKPNLSADGRYVVFSSYASNLVEGDVNGNLSDIFIHDRKTGKTEMLLYTEDGRALNGDSFLGAHESITPDARIITFYSSASNLIKNDLNRNEFDVFVVERGPSCVEVPVIDITQVTPQSIWPANNKSVDVTVEGFVSTPEGCEQSVATYTLSDEYGVYNTSGTLNLDVDGGFTLIATVEASRNGSDKDGRVYTIEIGASNEAGAVSLGVDVDVPHDQSGK